MNNSNETLIECSTRRPANLAWRIESNGHVTYARTKELAIELHKSKLEMCSQIEEILAKCSTASKA